MGGTEITAAALTDPTARIRVVPGSHGIEWLRGGWDLFMRAPVVWLVVLMVSVMLSIGLSFLPFIGMLTTILVPLFVSGLMHGCRALARGERLELQHIFDGFQHNTPNLLLLGLIDLALAFVGGLILFMAAMGTIGVSALTAMSTETLGGVAFVGGMAFVLLLALVISIPTAMVMWFSPALVAFHDVAPIDAAKLSFVACARNWAAFLLYGLMLIPLGLLAILPFGLGLLVLIPVIWLSIYASYVDVFEAAPQPQMAQITQM